MFGRALTIAISQLGRYQRAPCGFLLILLMVMWVSPHPVSAQLYSGSLTGIVTDPSGAIIPGATVTLTDIGKGFPYTTTTNATGRYLVRPLPPSTYRLTVESKGFKTYTREGIALDVNQNR